MESDDSFTTNPNVGKLTIDGKNNDRYANGVEDRPESAIIRSESKRRRDEFLDEEFHLHKSSHSLMSSVKGDESKKTDATIDGQASLLPEDTYSLLATAPISSPALLFALFVVVTQVTSWFFLIDSFTDIHDSENPFGVPADVEFHVRLVGFLGVLVAVFSQDDIVQSFNSLYNGFQLAPFEKQFGERRFQYTRWCVSIFLRIGQGSMGLLTVFLIVVRASNVVDMLLSFAAGEFISFIDDGALYFFQFFIHILTLLLIIIYYFFFQLHFP